MLPNPSALSPSLSPAYPSGGPLGRAMRTAVNVGGNDKPYSRFMRMPINVLSDRAGLHLAQNLLVAWISRGYDDIVEL